MGNAAAGMETPGGDLHISFGRAYGGFRIIFKTRLARERGEVAGAVQEYCTKADTEAGDDIKLMHSGFIVSFTKDCHL